MPFPEEVADLTFSLGPRCLDSLIIFSLMASEFRASETALATSPIVFERLHTYFLFPFALDEQLIQANHPQAWPGKTRWIDGLDSWIAGESGRRASQGMARLGPWKRASYSQFDVESPAYSDLLFFYSIVRHVFFDTNVRRHPDAQENQLRCYTIDVTGSGRLWLEGSDALGREASVEVTDLRLFLSAQGLGVLSIGVATGAIDAAQALWINRRLRKLYPIDADSIREGRTPNRLALRLQGSSQTEVICEERFEHPAMVGFYPPLANTVKSLLYFVEYALEEYEPVLDENMLVYCYAELNAGVIPQEISSPEFDATMQEFLYLHHKHDGATEHRSGGSRVLFAVTGHSCVILKVDSTAESNREARAPFSSARTFLEGDEPAIFQIFHTYYYLMAVISLFYRAALLDFSERSALASKRLLRDQQEGRLTLASVTMVNELRTQFLNFSGYWHFDELSSKQTHNEFFRRLCAEYKVTEMKDVLDTELRHMGDFVYDFYQLRNTEAVNRLAMLSLIFGGGAVVTGFFGMNFGGAFGQYFFEGAKAPFLHYLMVTFVCCLVLASLTLGSFVLLRSWRDYLALLSPTQSSSSRGSLKRGD
jgi:CorA-like Mg2+ transporter protein